MEVWSKCAAVSGRQEASLCLRGELSLGVKSNSVLTVSVEVEQFDIQMKSWYFSDLEAILNSYSCHSAYIQCFGPSFTAFEELFPLIDLHSTEGPGFSLIFMETFKRRTYVDIEEKACASMVNILVGGRDLR
jgi:hypothetical protein